MYFILHSEVKAKKRNFCPWCKKIMIKKFSQNHIITTYSCWNKNCMRKNIEFAIFQEELGNENQFKDGCTECQGEYNRELDYDKELENIDIRLRCLNVSCKENNYEYVFEINENRWEKYEVSPDIEQQFIIWYLFRRPSKKEFDLIHNFFTDRMFTLTKEDNQKESFDYRQYLEDKFCLHFKISVKDYGFTINAHKDNPDHTIISFNIEILKLLSVLYLELKKVPSGEVFIIPREKEEYMQFKRNKYGLRSINHH